MTLDEAIKHCEEVAEKQRSKAHVYEDMMVFNQIIKHNSEAEYYEALMNECIECAEEHRQLAEWLKELKALKENDNVKEVFKDCDTCKYLNIEADDYPCDRCMHRYINQYVYDDKREVNADECNL